MDDTTEIIAAVSFVATPLEEIGRKANEILALGWEPGERGDPWVASFRKKFPDGTTAVQAEEELRGLMGDLWVDPEEWPGATEGQQSPPSDT